MKKYRADELIVSRGYACDTHEAAALIMADKVRADQDSSTIINKPGMLLAEDIFLSVKKPKQYVSRGGYKLAGALDDFDLDVTELRCVDLGASTGGFTDCLLQRGAQSVCAIDVGYGQLAHTLQVDPRVTVFDRTNVRTADPASIGAPFDVVVADLSFIGLSQVAHDIARLVSVEGFCVLLIKPQFEARKDEVGEGGIVTDPDVLQQVLSDTIASLEKAGLQTIGLTSSSIKGAAGNTEYLVYCRKTDEAK